ncbi:hypothetical protein [Marinimicrobium sp. ARAG 43.8]|uniref:hypothetical protein n=1 Tax=Marinimicrobium sp. ARAG 43.8 TaxID=3418719 RepID=UPI003CE9D348
MKIGVVGRHPDLEKGFNGVMSMLWAKGFSEAGYSITLYLPISEAHDPYVLLQKAGLSSFDELESWGVEIKVLDSLDSIEPGTDVIIWQSYRPQEEHIRESLKRKGYFLVKNPPRLFSGVKAKDERKALGLSKQYDLIAAALCSDVGEGHEFPALSDKIAYVPRGFDLDKLVPDKGSVPTIGMDKAVKGHEFGGRSVEHIVSVGMRLKANAENVEFLSLRDNIECLGSKRVPLLGYPDFYREFINKLWIYMPVDFDYSVHSKGKSVLFDGSHRYVGLYENQVVETQLAGGLVISRRGDIPEELIMLPEESFVEDYTDISAVEHKIVEHIRNFDQRSMETRKLAGSVHNYQRAVEMLALEIEARL